MTGRITVRAAMPADAPALVEIYRPFVESSTVSFETEVPSVEEFARRISKYAEGRAWLVAEADGRLAGYGHASPHRSLGFEHVGVFRAAGRKFNAWHDVSWWQRRLRDAPLGE